MLNLVLDDAAALARLGDFPADLASALADKMDMLRLALADAVDANLSGAALTPRSGALRDSLDSDLQTDDRSLRAWVGVSDDLPYAAIQEFGGVTGPHEIVPDKARVLAFMLGGKRVFARRVRHPGSQIPARSYLRSALADAGDDIVAALQDALAAAASP